MPTPKADDKPKTDDPPAAESEEATRSLIREELENVLAEKGESKRADDKTDEKTKADDKPRSPREEESRVYEIVSEKLDEFKTALGLDSDGKSKEEKKKDDTKATETTPGTDRPSWRERVWK